MRGVVEEIRRFELTDAQRESLRQVLEEALRAIQAPASQTSAVRQSSPRPRSAPAPRRTEQFVYDVSVGTRTYRVALPEALPTLRGGGVDMKVAERRLHDLLLNNQLVSRGNNPANPPSPLAQVSMVGDGPGVQRFNQGSPNQRLDMFRDDYLKLTFQGGRYVESGEVRIAEAPHNTTRRN